MTPDREAITQRVATVLPLAVNYPMKKLEHRATENAHE